MIVKSIYSALILSIFSGVTLANTPKKISPYIGFSGNIDHLSGKRKDTVTEDDGGGTIVTTHLNNGKNMSNTNVGITAFGGLLWQPTAYPIVFGPELYFGRSTVNSRFSDVREDLVPQNRFYRKELERQYNYGIVARGGVKYNCLAFLLTVGFDRGHFKERTVLTYDPTNIKTIIYSKSKALSGLVLGAGVEKQINHFVIGIDFRYTRYKKVTTHHTFNAGAGLIPGTITLNAHPKIFATALRVSYQF